MKRDNIISISNLSFLLVGLLIFLFPSTKKFIEYSAEENTSPVKIIRYDNFSTRSFFSLMENIIPAIGKLEKKK